MTINKNKSHVWDDENGVWERVLSDAPDSNSEARKRVLERNDFVAPTPLSIEEKKAFFLPLKITALELSVKNKAGKAAIAAAQAEVDYWKNK